MKEVKLPEGFVEMTTGDVVVARCSIGQYQSKNDAAPKPRGLLQAQDGTLAWAPSHADLTRKLQAVRPGSVVRIQCGAKADKKTRFGVKAAYSYKVWTLSAEEIGQLPPAEKDVRALLAAPAEHDASDDVEDAPF